MNARTTALKALLHVDENEGYSNIVIDKALRDSGLDERDRALASALFYGVLERRITLDRVISSFSKTPVSRLSPVVLEILRIAVYQILFLEKIPTSAAVNEAVNSVKEYGMEKASGFVNGVLRSVLRSPEPLSFSDREEQPDEFLSISYSCPIWLIRLWKKEYGEENALGLLQSLSGSVPVYVRVNTRRTTPEQLCSLFEEHGLAAKKLEFPDSVLRLESPGAISALPGYAEGLFHVQDLSSQICCACLGPKPGERVLDVCAAPGGKTFTMAERMDDEGDLESFDLYRGKVGLIRAGAHRLGLSSVRASVRDASHPKESLAPADRVLCDVPCSGLGIIRRKPEIRYKPPQSLKGLPDLQYGILCSSAELVREGGVLCYSTCTLNPEENEQIADRFLGEHPDFIPLELSLSADFPRMREEKCGRLTLAPHINGSDGFFFALFRREKPSERRKICHPLTSNP